jgi:hypothetical protein
VLARIATIVRVLPSDSSSDQVDDIISSVYDQSNPFCVFRLAPGYLSRVADQATEHKRYNVDKAKRVVATRQQLFDLY